MAKKKAKSRFYNLSSILGWFGTHLKIMFIILLGARGYGKTYSVQNFMLKKFIKKGIPFYWIRLTEASTRKLLENNAMKLIDPKLVRKYNLVLQTNGKKVYSCKCNKDGEVVSKKLMCTVMALSTFYSDKGVAEYDADFLTDPNMYYHIVIDEFQKEKTEKSQGDLAYQFVNQLENILRNTSERTKIFIIGNTLEEASDILASCFNFIPEEFGRYYLKSKRAIVDYMESSESYKKSRINSVASILAPDESTFTNKIKSDNTLVYKGRVKKPQCIIKFTKDEKNWFTLWDNNVIAEYKKESSKDIIAMRPYIDEAYNQEKREIVIGLFDRREFRFRTLITFKKFQKNIQLIKPRKA